MKTATFALSVNIMETGTGQNVALDVQHNLDEGRAKQLTDGQSHGVAEIVQYTLGSAILIYLHEIIGSVQTAKTQLQ